MQVDLYHPFYPKGWQRGMALHQLDASWQQLNADHKTRHAASGESAAFQEWHFKTGLDLNTAVRNAASHFLNQGKMVAVLGGEHSVPLGLMQAHHTQALHNKTEFGILHLDAHLDYRNAYEGLTFSHASIMYNASQMPNINRIVSVGIRDYCQEEVDYAASYARARVHYMHNLRAEQFKGSTWAQQCDSIIQQLPDFLCHKIGLQWLLNETLI